MGSSFSMKESERLDFKGFFVFISKMKLELTKYL